MRTHPHVHMPTVAPGPLVEIEFTDLPKYGRGGGGHGPQAHFVPTALDGEQQKTYFELVLT